jgi:hypothetical protein
MPTVLDQALYNRVKQRADQIYSKPSAYKSGYIVKTYKSLGGEYKSDSEPKKLKQWFRESWRDVGNKDYPVYRPTVRVNESTPKTVREIAPDKLQRQIALKQKYRGNKNLPPF